MVEQVPRPPEGVGEPGVRLWTSIASEFVLNAGELEILRQAMATADEIALLEAELRASSLMIRISLTGFDRLDYVVWHAFEGFRRSCRFLDMQGS